MSINIAAIAAIMIYLGPGIPAVEFLGIGIGPIIIASTYALGLRLLYFDQKIFAAEKTQAEKVAKREHGTLTRAIGVFAISAIGAFDLAVGNIFGSNSFNILILLVTDPFHPGPLLTSVSRSHILTALATIMATSIAVMGQLYQVEKRKTSLSPMHSPSSGSSWRHF